MSIIALLRASKALTALAGAVVVAVLAVVTSAPAVAALVWLLSGIAVFVRAPLRAEPTAAMRLLGVANVVVGATWTVVAAGVADPLGLGTVWLLAVGMTGIGTATLAATPTWQHRAALLDGLVAALATAVVVLAVADVRMAATGQVLAALVLLATTLFGPAVMAASLLQRNLRPAVGAVVPALGMVALVVAGASTAAAVLTGGGLGAATEVAWAVVPVAGLVVALWLLPTHEVPDHAEARRPTASGLTVLAVLGLLPTVVGLVDRDHLLLGLTVSLVAAAVVLARVAVSARFDVADARATANVRFDTLVEHAAEVLALVDDTGKLFYVSRAVEETFHVPRDLVLGTSPADLAHPQDRPELAALLARAADRPGVPLSRRLRLLDGRAAVRHVETTVVDLRHVQGIAAVSLTVRDVSERVSLESELVRQARTDGLTGLATRSVLIERVDHALTARRPRAALLFLDVDDFKLVNDGYGHAAGDEVLAVLASRLRQAVRVHDTPGRMGGDEFAVLLEELSDDPVDDALRTARRVAEAASVPVQLEGETLDIHVSVGVALPEPGMTGAELFAAADAAMYEAKRSTRGVVLYEHGMRAPSRSRLRLLRDVREAIDRGTIEVCYQPIVRASTQQLEGAEALLRWTHPVLGDIDPGVVLEHADASGLTAELTRHVLSQVRADLDHWCEVTGTVLPLSLNLSAEQLAHVDPEEVVLGLLGRPDAHGALTIEVTETSMLGDLSAAAQVLHVFRDAGCHVAIDDFGTGHASIGYLRRLPLDRLKIDREFIDGLLPHAAEHSFAAVIQGLADALSLETVAEGVEHPTQLAAVQAMGCDLVQGYLFSPGVPMSELLQWAGHRTGQPAAAAVAARAT